VANFIGTVGTRLKIIIITKKPKLRYLLFCEKMEEIKLWD
jgi:hypothetical protein